MLTNINFTDPQGQTFTDAVVRVNSASRDTNISTNTSTRLSYLDGTPNVETFSNENASDRVNCSFVYWPTQYSFDNGFAPYILVNSDGQQNFTVDKEELEKVEYEGLELEQVCETFFELNLI